MSEGYLIKLRLKSLEMHKFFAGSEDLQIVDFVFVLLRMSWQHYSGNSRVSAGGLHAFTCTRGCTVGRKEFGIGICHLSGHLQFHCRQPTSPKGTSCSYSRPVTNCLSWVWRRRWFCEVEIGWHCFWIVRGVYGARPRQPDTPYPSLRPFDLPPQALPPHPQTLGLLETGPKESKPC